jgi:hypothetical protein
MDVSSTGIYFPGWVWLIALVVALLCVGLLVAILIQHRRGSLWLMRGIKLAVLALLALVGAELLGDPLTLPAEDWRPWWKLTEVGLLVASSVAVVSAASWRRSTQFWKQWGQPSVLLVVSLAIVAIAHWRMEKPLRDELAQSHRFMESLEDVRHAQIRSEGKFAETDAGRRVELERFISPPPTESDQGASTPHGPATRAKTSLPEGYQARVIVADEASDDSPANCHGWVFTEGRYLIRGRYVDVILRDNNYRVVTEPEPGDLIVYRDESGEPIHTGIVKAVGDEGFVLIESKWGSLDACLHLPNDQVYSRSYAYYRSSRRGHVLKGAEAPPT